MTITAIKDFSRVRVFKINYNNNSEAPFNDQLIEGVAELMQDNPEYDNMNLQLFSDYALVMFFNLG